MVVTSITEKNEEYFRPFLNDMAKHSSPAMLRLGITDDDGNVAGAIGAMVDHSSIEIESLYVLEDFRRQGYGSRLVLELEELALNSGEYSSLSVSMFDDDGMEEFFESLGFDIFDGIVMYYVMLGEVFRSEKLRQYLLKSDIEGIYAISDLGSAEKKKLYRYLTMIGMPLRGYYDPEWSTVTVGDGEINGVMLAVPCDDEIKVIAQSMDSAHYKKAISQLKVLAHKIELDERYDSSSRITFASNDDRFIEIVMAHIGRFIHKDSHEQGIRAIKLL